MYIYVCIQYVSIHMYTYTQTQGKRKRERESERASTCIHAWTHSQKTHGEVQGSAIETRFIDICGRSHMQKSVQAYVGTECFIYMSGLETSSPSLDTASLRPGFDFSGGCAIRISLLFKAFCACVEPHCRLIVVSHVLHDRRHVRSLLSSQAILPRVIHAHGSSQCPSIHISGGRWGSSIMHHMLQAMYRISYLVRYVWYIIWHGGVCLASVAGACILPEAAP